MLLRTSRLSVRQVLPRGNQFQIHGYKHSYLAGAGKPSRVLVSIGATRYTDWGEHNFLQDGDLAAVILYPEAAYTHEEILSKLESRTLDDADISALCQTVKL